MQANEEIVGLPVLADLERLFGLLVELARRVEILVNLLQVPVQTDLLAPFEMRRAPV